MWKGGDDMTKEQCQDVVDILVNFIVWVSTGKTTSEKEVGSSGSRFGSA